MSLASDRIRTLILAGECPWCGRTGFLVPARHTATKHGIAGRELRERMGLPWSAVIAAPEVSERRRELNARSSRKEWIAALRPPRGPRTISPAARATSSNLAKRITHRPGLASPIGTEQRERIRNAQRNGETYRSIAAREGLSDSTIHRIVNGRKRGVSGTPRRDSGRPLGGGATRSGREVPPVPPAGPRR